MEFGALQQSNIGGLQEHLKKVVEIASVLTIECKTDDVEAHDQMIQYWIKQTTARLRC